MEQKFYVFAKTCTGCALERLLPTCTILAVIKTATQDTHALLEKHTDADITVDKTAICDAHIIVSTSPNPVFLDR